MRDIRSLLNSLGSNRDNLAISERLCAQKGIARGPVKIVMSPRQMDKVQEGNILVSTMTMSDFMPAIRKAAAIITDEGGILCHAAIIARELKKPCVTGTKIATQVLKDDDLVEVDATKGIIKIIKA